MFENCSLFISKEVFFFVLFFGDFQELQQHHHHHHSSIHLSPIHDPFLIIIIIFLFHLLVWQQFPYIKKRLLVVYHQGSELSPIDCALDEIRGKLAELDDVVNQSPPDVKKLHLKLQGFVSV